MVDGVQFGAQAGSLFVLLLAMSDTTYQIFGNLGSLIRLFFGILSINPIK